MDVAKVLDDMREEVEGCGLVAFADLSSHMVLRASSARKRGQEEIDVLTHVALQVLGGPVAEGAAALIGRGPATAVVMSKDAINIFLRTPKAANEALIAVCSPDTDVRKLVDCGRRTLDLIVDEA